jgi:hypothetical protein
MQSPMMWGGSPMMGHPHGHHPIGVPLIPAPMAFVAMLFGMMMGVMIGRQKAMMSGMGTGMSGACGGDAWMMRKKKMMGMGMMGMHHHHGEGPACGCGHAGDASSGERDDASAM